MSRNTTGKALRASLCSRVGIRKGPRGLLPAHEQAARRRRAHPHGIDIVLDEAGRLDSWNA